jgi:hypothetical protein
MVNDKLNVTHTRWRDGIIGYQIVGVEHVKGANNTVADALSRADDKSIWGWKRVDSVSRLGGVFGDR